MKNLNITEAPISFQEMLNKCSSENVSIDDDEVLTLHIAQILFCVLSLITAAIAVIANGLIIWVISRTFLLHDNPSNILLFCLAIADFLTGAITQPASVSVVVALETGKYEVYCTAVWVSITVGYFLSGVSFLTLTAVSLDRFLALHLHLRYRELVTIPRVLAAEAGFCAVMVGFGVVQLTLGVRMRDTLVIIIEVAGLVVNAVSYLGILKTLTKQKAAVQAQAKLASYFHGSTVSEMTARRKSSLTMFLAFLLFCVSYIPPTIFVLTSFVSSQINGNRIIFLMFANFFVALNSSLRPLVFCFRISEIRRAIVRMLTRNSVARVQNFRDPR